MNTKHRIIFGDSRYIDELNDNSIQLVVTSPPYWQVKDYNTKGQVGFNQSYPEYIKSLNQVWSECFRVLEPGCRMCINVGDQFTRASIYGRYKIIPIREEIIRFCESIGFDYMGAIIWQKVTTCNTSGGASVMGSFPYPRNGILKLDYEFILIFKKPGKTGRKIDKSIKRLSRISNDEWKEWFSGHWYFPGEKQNEHIAMFPVELPRRLIKMFTFAGETVLDPFLGSGTTSSAALLTDRNSIGYELDKDLKNTILNKLNSKINLTNIDSVSISFENARFRQGNDEAEAQKKAEKYIREIEESLHNIGSACDGNDAVHKKISGTLQKLSVLLKNPEWCTDKYIDIIIADVNDIVNIDGAKHLKSKKQIHRYIDEIINKLNGIKFQYFYTFENIKRASYDYDNFKSIISRKEKDKKNSGFVKVTGIIDANHIQTQKGDIITLAGVMPFENEFVNNQAVDYLKENVLNRKVAVELEDGDLKTGYIKLRDRTHINAKLIKNGLARVDTSTAKKFLQRFTLYSNEAMENKQGYWSLQ